MSRPGLGILGVGETSLGKHPGRTSLDLLTEAALQAITDASLEVSDISGIVTPGTRTADLLIHAAVVAEHLGIRPSFLRTVSLGGATHIACLLESEAAVTSGAADHILFVGGDNLRTLSRAAIAQNLGREGAAHPEYEHPVGATIPSLYALMAARYLHETGTSERDLAAVAVSMRQHASRNPNAHMRDPITIEDVMSSPAVASPLKRLDCCPVSDGAGAFVLGRPRPGIQRDVPVLGVGEYHDGAYLTTRGNLTRTGAIPSGAAAYAMAGVPPDSIDIAYLYDSFTITVLMQLEDLQLCPRGGSAELVRSGGLDLEAARPVNTHGGLLSHGHPGRAGGIFHLIEAVHQLRGEAGPRQTLEPRRAVVHGSAGALSSHATAILGWR
jgi:acetyl-CoA acetyltransferase